MVYKISEHGQARSIRSGMIAAVLAILAITASADTAQCSVGNPSTAAQTETLLVGKTGIYCVTTPCPWKGVQRIGADGAPELIWSADELPEITASYADARQLRSAWDAGECLAITGTLEDGHLVVQSLGGAC